MISQLQRFATLILFTLLVVPSVLSAQVIAPNNIFDTLAKHLGLFEHQTLLEQGNVVHTALLGDEQLPEEIVVVGAMLLVKGVAPDAVIKAFMHSEIFKEAYNVERYQALSQSGQHSYTFKQLTLDPKLTQTLQNPEREYNLSIEEAKKLKVVDIRDKQETLLATEEVWRNLLENRLESFIDTGINGITPYFQFLSKNRIKNSN